MDLRDYDILECPNCGEPVKPGRVNKNLSVRYRHRCPNGTNFGWTIDRDGNITNETFN